jgi:hypothetical protein
MHFNLSSSELLVFGKVSLQASVLDAHHNESNDADDSENNDD